MYNLWKDDTCDNDLAIYLSYFIYVSHFYFQLNSSIVPTKALADPAELDRALAAGQAQVEDKLSMHRVVKFWTPKSYTM